MRLVLLTAWLWTALAGVASADPVTATIVGTFFAAGTTAAAIATFVINTAIAFGIGAIGSKLFAPKAGAAAAQERQASIVTMSLGEVPREMIVGKAGTGGSLADVVNFGGEYGTDREALVIVVADHECEALTHFWVGDQKIAFAGDGPVEGYNGQLEVYWRPGAIDDAPFPEGYQALAPALGPAALKGQAKILAIYSLDRPEAAAPVFPAGRPSFVWEIKGAKCYDARKDSSVEGGSGAHRRDDPTTWEWSDNAEVCRYAYSTGVYYPGHFGEAGFLLVGRGLTEYEAPPVGMIAAANICDELVDDGDGDVRRYRVGGVLRSDQSFIEVEEMFAAAMAGRIIQPAGGVAVEPGQGKVPIEITDDDLLVGEQVTFNEFKSDSDRINTVVVRYVEPSQKWQDHAAGVQRLDAVDLIADGGPRTDNLSLSLVTDRGQAERIGSIRLREGRLERSAAIVLGPRFWFVEEGDWLRWTSARHTKGLAVDFRVTTFALAQSWTNSLAIEEVSVDSYDGIAGVSTTLPSGAVTIPDALVLTGVTAVAVELQGEGENITPAIRFEWDTPVDDGVLSIRAEIRRLGSTFSTPTILDLVNAGQADVTNGVGGAMAMQARLVPKGVVGRVVVPSPWITITTSGFVSYALSEIDGLTPKQLGALLRAVAAQGQAQTTALLQAANQLLANRQAVSELTLHNGRKVRQIVIDDDETFLEGDASVFKRTNLMGQVSEDGNAFILNESTLKVSSTETLAQFRTGIASTFGTTNAAITAEVTARSNADSALASSINSVSTTVGGHTASITTLQTSINGLEAEWVLTVQAGGRIAGIRTHAGSSVSSILLMADAVGITDGTGNYYPFSVSGGVVRMTNVEVDTIKANTIVTNHLVGGAVTAMDGDIAGGDGASYTLNAYGGRVLVIGYAEIGTSTGAEAGTVARLYADDVEIAAGSIYCPGSWGGVGCTIFAFHMPGSGSCVYRVGCSATPGSGPHVINKTSVVVVELKK